MQILDQNFNEVVDIPEPTWDQCGSFCYQSKINQIAYWLRLQPVNLSKVLIISDYRVDAKAINQSDVDLVLINFSDHAVPYYDVRVITKPYSILHWDFNDTSYHPYHLIYSNIVCKHDEVDLTGNRKYKVSCINGKPRVSRIYNILNLSKTDFYHDVLVTWRQVTDTNPIPDWDLKQIAITDLTDQQWQEFWQLQKSLPNTPILTEELACASIGPGLTDTYLNLVTESSCENDGFLTEKIYKPLRASQLFIVQGPPGSIAYLRSLGFDVFDDCIDHSYDLITDWKTRVDASLESLKSIYNNIDNIWHATTDRRIANRQLIASDTVIKQLAPAHINI
jgi:hypothetical protein